MTVADNLRKLCAAAEPYVEQLLDIAEAMSELREKATEQGIDWSQAKALLVARARDNRDGGHRVEKLISKAENAAAYVVMLDRPNVAHNRETPPQSSVSRETAIPIDAGATGSPRHVAEPAPSTRPPPAPGAGSSFPEPDPRDDIRNQPFYRGAVS